MNQLELPLNSLVIKWKYILWAVILCWPLIGAAGFYGSAYVEKKDVKSEQIKLMIVEVEKACKAMRARRIDASLSDGNFYYWCVK